MQSVDERELRRDIMRGVHRVVVKVGSNLLVSLESGLSRDFISKIVSQLAQLQRKGLQIVLVSSGAIAAGMDRLQMKKRPQTIAELQATAAIGQSTLMHIYEEAFAPWGIKVGQVLLTHEDMGNRKRYINARNTLLTLLNLDIIPIVNENDSVVIDEIKVGDNDTLAALVSSIVDADLLVILTDIDGLYDKEPGMGGKLVSLVRTVTRDIEGMARGAQSEIGIGGMVTKVGAAKLAAQCCIPTVVASGNRPRVLEDIVKARVMGSLFLGRSQRLKGRKRWIGVTLRSKGRLQLDKGAYGAISQGGKSLLPSGILAVEGEFDRGDPVSCLDPKGNEFARGLVNYDSQELRKILGVQSSQVKTILGYKYADEIIHRDNLVLL